jgi:hypothetical protein
MKKKQQQPKEIPKHLKKQILDAFDGDLFLQTFLDCENTDRVDEFFAEAYIQRMMTTDERHAAARAWLRYVEWGVVSVPIINSAAR